MTLKNHTSEMPPNKSLSLIEELLVEAGASNINKEYKGKMPTSISFLLLHEGETLAFRIQANQSDVFSLLWRNIKKPIAGTRERYEAQAWRTAWKNIHDLIAAQVAILLTEQASIVEMFMPYLLDRDGRATLAERFESGTIQKLLNP